MTTEDYLFQGVYLNERLLSKATELSALQKANSCGSEDFRDTMEKLIVEEATEFNEMITLKRDLMCMINQVENGQYQLLLEMRYLLGRSWEEIAAVLGYGRNSVLRMHKRALEDVEKIRGKLEPM